jgi:exopolyphosphatase / guanosine-5'-triphosphate,3'-diphosphate pyrophosphatase
MLRDTILALARRYDFEEGHSLRDEVLALRLFDEASRLGLLRLDPPVGNVTPREILSSAAILHDIGYVEGYEEHHKTAFRLIMRDPIAGLTEDERTLVALVARYHRGGLPDPARHSAFAGLDQAGRDLVTQLGAILRFADGLDRSHTNAVRDLHCLLEGDRLSVALLPGHGDGEERWAGQKKARWFETVFEVTVTLG